MRARARDLSRGRGAVMHAAVAARLATKLPKLLRRRLTPAAARRELEARLARRSEDFLQLVERAVFGRPQSPWRELMQIAGCELGDLKRLVREDGLEATLARLHAAGVFLTVDELKGRRATVRSGRTVAVDPRRLANPTVAGDVAARTSGSRGSGVPVLIALEFVRDCAVDALLALEARDGLGWRKAIWEAPGTGATFRLLKYASFGAPPAAFFSAVHLNAPELHARYRWSERLIRWESRALGVPLPRPLHAPLDDPLPVARWLAEALRRGEIPHLFTLGSPAVRLCSAARAAGLDLTGARIVLGGEPVTAARIETVQAAGAEPLPRYGSIESGPIGYACVHPANPDDVHLLEDLHAVIQPRGVTATAAGALFVTSLRTSAPLVLINASMGDRADVSERSCGCPLEALGWRRHLSRIRSFEKLTGEGITLLDSDVLRVLEEVLPARFGGTLTDYQLIEDEAADGAARVRLRVAPRVGHLDENDLVEAFLAALHDGRDGEWMMARLWRDGGTVRVERAEPLATSSGKIHHLISPAR